MKMAELRSQPAGQVVHKAIRLCFKIQHRVEAEAGGLKVQGLTGVHMKLWASLWDSVRLCLKIKHERHMGGVQISGRHV